MLVLTREGLYCPQGNFYIDPCKGVEHAVVTHAHSDHARRGSENYYCEQSGKELLKQRLSQKINVTTYKYQEPFFINGVKLSFHSAGHILGSSQVRIEYGDKVWVASGDYKREPDPTCVPFEVVPCDVFVTEATFGTPRYTWPKNLDVGKEIFEWWQQNREQGINSVLFAYSLGKAQRVLGLLEPYAKEGIICHSTVTPLNECYHKEGVRLAKTKCVSECEPDFKASGELFLVPQSFLKSEHAGMLGENYKTAFASGWMADGSHRYGGSIDQGFVLSDHADWNDLLLTIKETGAKTVYVQHRNGKLVRHLRQLGLKAYPDSDLKIQPQSQLSLF